MAQKRIHIKYDRDINSDKLMEIFVRKTEKVLESVNIYVVLIEIKEAQKRATEVARLVFSVLFL